VRQALGRLHLGAVLPSMAERSAVAFEQIGEGLQ
jgi:hypothetical protein